MKTPLFTGVRALILIALLGAGTGCATTGGAIDSDSLEGVEEARAYYEAGAFSETIRSAQRFLAERPGSRDVDEAVFLLARSYYEEGEYLESEDRFRRLLRDFPNTEFAEEASYYLGLAILSMSRGPELDQTETRAAHIQLRSFINQFPDSEYVERAEGHIADIRAKLAEKEYRNSITYKKLGRRYRKSAIFYFDENVYTKFPDTPWAPEAGLQIIGLYMDDRNWEKAAEWCGRVIADHPGTQAAEKAAVLLEQAVRELERSKGS